MVIARYYLARYAPEYGNRVKASRRNAVVALRKYRWPGNIRELENRLKKAIVLTEKTLLGPDDSTSRPTTCRPILPLAEAKEKFQRDYINEAWR